MRLLLAAFAALFLAAVVVTTAPAETLQNVPLFSPLRASLAVGADYAFYSGAQAPAFPVKKEWQGGVFGAYKLTPTLALVGGTRYGVDSKQFDSKIGLRLKVWSGTGE